MLTSDQLTKETRGNRIKELMVELNMEKFEATLYYDQYEAPNTTNLQQLLREGYIPNNNLDELLKAMVKIGLQIIGADHLSDEEIYTVLTTKVLTETVTDLYPFDDVHEIVDLSYVKTPNPITNNRKFPRPNRILLESDTVTVPVNHRDSAQ